MQPAEQTVAMLKCKYCQTDLPVEMFAICRVVNGRVYRRLRCQRCKRAKTNERRTALRQWLDDYKKTLACSRCGFSDYRALVFHHKGSRGKDFGSWGEVGERACPPLRIVLS
jgi:hypothetical protein